MRITVPPHVRAACLMRIPFRRRVQVRRDGEVPSIRARSSQGSKRALALSNVLRETFFRGSSTVCRSLCSEHTHMRAALNS